MTAATGAAGAPSSASFNKAVAAASVGTAIEWYDFFLYGFLAPLVFDQLFFPQLSPFVGSLVVYGTLAVGFAARPLGGILFGALGDRVGRKRVLFIALCMMGLCTAAMGCLPGYAAIGAAAPVLLVLLRFCQGLAIGGQFAGAMVITVESAPQHRRGLYGAFIQCAGYVGIIMASGSVALLSLLPRDDMMSWGWRVPFLASIVLLAVALYVRARVEESPVFETAQSVEDKVKAPVLEVLKRYPGRTLIVTAISAAETGFYYIIAIFALAYGSRTLGHSQSLLANAVVIGASIGLVAVPFLGALSDRIGRRPMFMTGTFLAAVYIWFFFEMMQAGPAYLAALAIILGVAVIHPIMYAPEGSFIAELFETRIRMTGMSLGKQVGAVLGAGLAPMISAWIVGVSGGRTEGVVIYFVAMAAVAFVASLLAKETSRISLYTPPA